jgi:hypothetical protein
VVESELAAIATVLDTHRHAHPLFRGEQRSSSTGDAALPGSSSPCIPDPAAPTRHGARVSPGRPGEEHAMPVAVLLHVLIGLFLPVKERFAARVFGPDEDPDGPGPQGSVEPTARSHIRRGRIWRRWRTPDRRTSSPRVGNLRPLPLGSDSTATRHSMLRAKVHRDRHSGNGADIDRQNSGQLIEGRGPWTQR